jgi:endonuclease-3 related protein
VKKRIQIIYELLLDSFGPQKWWPAETPFEVIVGAILTQQTSWKNVEKAIRNLKRNDLLSPFSLYALPIEELKSQIRPSGFYNVKAERLKDFLKVFVEEFNGKIANLKKEDKEKLRIRLLKIKGLGRETVDSILLYALDKEVFVVDAYTFRIFKRNGIIDSENYEELRSLVEESLSEKGAETLSKFKEMHALIIELGKKFCKKVPQCNRCPLKEICAKKGVEDEFSRDKKVFNLR